ncbi:hypothetical protein Rhopal_001457-T1 [Rhodotorula paludigena]|uniref:Choline monooxygenase, chloroplastic n=1 Tax=Rhodotorula paludigena TaxID=86838 RepID=A0AAV5G7F3_9BASI|nr:hypothetical protein Rhopal_001457-T1 [Rhodotorula paludigena]
MASYLSSLLGRASKPSGPEATAMPAAFYTSDAIYRLEQRAVFSKMWLMICHERFLNETGKFQLVNFAGLEFFVIRSKAGDVGEADVTTRTGKVNIIACGYHGWSYSTNGDLAKAPGFQDVPGFENKDHGLFDLRVHVDKNGFVYVNADKSPDAISWKQQFGDFEDQDRFKRIDWENFDYALSWSMEDAPYNWKVLSDNYNECHHCSFTHPGFVQTTDLKSYSVKGGEGHIAHYVKAKPEALVPGTDPEKFAFNYVLPSSSHTITPLYFYNMRIQPNGPRSCSVHYDVYRHKDCTDDVFDETHKFFVQVETEDKMLCANTQKSLERGNYNSGPLHPTREAGVIYFQRTHVETLRKHFEKEQAAGHEIRGGQHTYGSLSEKSSNAFVQQVEGCAGACGSGGKENEW